MERAVAAAAFAVLCFAWILLPPSRNELRAVEPSPLSKENAA